MPSESQMSGKLAAGAVALLMAVVLLVALLIVFEEDDNNACLGMATGTGDGSVPQPSGTGPKLDVRVATWNVNYFNSRRNINAGIRSVAKQADVIGLQELGPADKRRSVIRSLPNGWAGAREIPGNMTAIAYRKTTLKLVDQGVEQSMRFEHVEDGGSGTGVGPRYTTYATFQVRTTGAVFSLINLHMVPTIDSNGHPDEDRPKRVALAVNQQDQAGQIALRLKARGAVFLTMDSNVDARADAQVKDPRFPYIRLARYGLYTSWRALGFPTGKPYGRDRYIDYVMSTATQAAPVAHQLFPNFGSDHNPVVAAESSTPRSLAASASSTSGAAPAASQEPESSTGSSAATTTTTALLPRTLVIPGPRGPMTLSGEQVTNATIVISEGKAAGVPVRGWVVALAAALQESKIKNLRYGDSTSEGMFQQLVGGGWGTAAQIRDPHLATKAFYGVAQHTRNPGLTDISGWEQMSVTQAAQAVQRSAFPNAYAQWQPAAEAVVKALSGVSGAVPGDAGLECSGADGSAPNCPATGMPAEKLLTPDALRVLRCVAGKWPQITTIGTYPGHEPDETRAVDIMIPDYNSPAGRTLGQEISRWVQANARQLGVQYVIYYAQIWNIERDAEGWRVYRSITGHDDASSLHYNHVHVSVYGDRGAGFPATSSGADVAPGAWTMPLPTGSYRIGCGIECYAGHTGQDFPVHSGTPVYATNAGVVMRSTFLGAHRSYGNLIVIRASGQKDTQVFYAHLQRRDVVVGQTVRAGQQIALSGFTGHVIPAGEGGAHLHYEIRVGGNPVDPLPILRQNGVRP